MHLLYRRVCPKNENNLQYTSMTHYLLLYRKQNMQYSRAPIIWDPGIHGVDYPRSQIVSKQNRPTEKLNKNFGLSDKMTVRRNV
jgi:hypothetical protein